MCKKLVSSFIALLVLGSVNSGLAKDTTLVARWTLQEGAGTVAKDITWNGHDGQILGAPWVSPGFDGTKSCLEFGFCSAIEVPDAPELNFGPADSYTFCAWVNMTRLPSASDPWAGILSKGREALANYYCAVLAAGTGQLVFGHSGNNLYGSPLRVGEWMHMACVYDAGLKRIVINGKEDANTNSSQNGSTPGTPFCMGKNNAFSECSACRMNEVRLYSRALTDEEIVGIMPGGGGLPELAGNPIPSGGAKDVPRDTDLAWKPGDFARTHDVYLGTDFNDVNNASRTTPLDVLASQGQDANTFDPIGLFGFGQTYYWRVDEVNAPEKPGIFKGDVWSFKVEDYGYYVKPVKATASGSSAGQGPEKTIDSSGLNAKDQHSTSATSMWLSKKGQVPAWIQYEFDKVYSLHEMWVWNSNLSSEPTAGLGAKDVTITYSTDGSTWATLAGVPPFNQGTGDPSYVHNTTVGFGGVRAKFVKLTVATNYSTKGVQQYGLSEVRFFYAPVWPYLPKPASGDTGVAVDGGVLNWRPGREAAKHQVYLGTDPNALAVVDTVTTHSLAVAPLGLQYGKTYYWKVNEVNDAQTQTPSTWEGDMWHFTTIGYRVVEDFESYDDACNRIFFAWVDGFGYSASPDCGVAASAGNGTGSTVGNTNPPFAARKPFVHSGNQAMPMAFDNTRSPLYSETQREWKTPQAWAGRGVNNLTVYLQGVATAFVETSPGTFVMNGKGTDIWNTLDEFRYAYKPLKGDGTIIARVDNVSPTDGWAKAGVMIRETLEPGSAHAFMCMSASYGTSYQYRMVANNAMAASSTSDAGGLKAPYWVKVTRKGDVFTAQQSADGTTWVDVPASPAVQITMAADVYIGLAVTSHTVAASEAVCGAKFSNVTINGNVSGPWQTAEVGVAQPAGNALDTFYVAVEDSAGTIKVVSNPDRSLIATGTWEACVVPLSEFTSAGVNLNSVKKLVLGVGDRTSPKISGTGKLYIDDIRLQP